MVKRARTRTPKRESTQFKQNSSKAMFLVVISAKNKIGIRQAWILKKSTPETKRRNGGHAQNMRPGCNRKKQSLCKMLNLSFDINEDTKPPIICFM
jgi:hypothetical protein